MMTDVVLTQSGSFDFRNLSEVELEVIVQVIQKDFEIKASEKARLRRRRRKLKEADERVTILASSNFNDNFCVICFKRFVILFYPKRCCISCRHWMCRACSVWVSRDKQYICLLCQNERTLKSMGCDWYYGLLKNKFQHDASELVAQSLYSNQGQYSIVQIFFRKICVKFKPEWMSRLKPLESTGSSQDAMITPDLLQKVKGAQISRYRQKIQCKWDEMHDKLRRLELSEMHRVKREEAYRSLNDEYKMQFKNLLKEFSQVLYITLENYAAKIEDMHLNINEQVIDTVHEEVELLIGYKINLAPEDMQSIVSDVESTVSLFMGNQLEERLAIALVNKINEDHHKASDFGNYDIDCLDQIRPDDVTSSTTYLYHTNPVKEMMLNGPKSSGRSSLNMFNRADLQRSGKLEFSSHMVDSSQCGSESDFNTEEEMKYDVRSDAGPVARSEVALSAKEVQHIMKYPNSDRFSLVERHISVPINEPINLLVELSSSNRIDIIWTMSSMGRKMVLRNDANTEILTSNDGHCISSNLRIWDSKAHNAGLYTAFASSRPVAAFMVTVIDCNLPPVKPGFRLNMLNCSVRSGQSAQFSVETVGNPEPKLVFYHNDIAISVPSEKYSLDHVTNINRHIFKINRVTVSDRGTYKCVASNDLGSIECAAELQVTSINFRFEKTPVYTHSSGSSIDGATPTEAVHDTPDFKTFDTTSTNNNNNNNESIFDSNASVNQACQGERASSTTDLDMDLSQTDTVIGRELPDDINMYCAPPIVRNNNNGLHRTFSSESDDSCEVSPNTARAMALRSSVAHRNDSASRVAQLRDIFDQQSSSQPFQRAESITRRTPPYGKRKLESQLSREVRIRRNDGVVDEKR